MTELTVLDTTVSYYSTRPRTQPHGHGPLSRLGAGEYIIQNWMRNRNTIEFLGLWEQPLPRF